MSAFKNFLTESAEKVDDFLSTWLLNEGYVGDLCTYAVIGGGKKFRPSLSLIFAEGQPDDVREDILKAGCAAELIHAFSLVHDDLPEMDGDMERRGKPSFHARYGHAQALLCGDWLCAASFRLLAELSKPEREIKISDILGKATTDMIEGQLLEFQSEDSSVEGILAIHKLKTGALMKASIMSGALLAYGESALESKDLNTYADNIGLLFQISDDYLDADVEETGNIARKLGGRKECYEFAIKIADKAKEAAFNFGKNNSKLMVQAVDYLLERMREGNDD